MTISDRQMGGNNSYNKTLDRVKGNKRTHQEFHDRIDGHKILLQNRNQNQVKLPVNSNSDSPIYLGGRRIDKEHVEVTTIGIYEKHKCVGQIDLKFDENGKFIPYSKEDKGSSHFHLFTVDPETGRVERKSHDNRNTFPIDDKYEALIKKVVEYNQTQCK